MPIKLIVGLGNPGKKYESTRHNAGFWLVERLAAQHRLSLRKEPKFHGTRGQTRHSVRHAWLLLPQNLDERIGTAVGALAQFHKIAADEILVAHDELDLPPGGVKIKQAAATQATRLERHHRDLGTPDFWRLRIGIGHPRDVAARASRKVVDFVPTRREGRPGADRRGDRPRHRRVRADTRGQDGGGNAQAAHQAKPPKVDAEK